MNSSKQHYNAMKLGTGKANVNANFNINKILTQKFFV